MIRAAGHADFRDARGPLGLTQRQAGGRFTREEADALISRLEAEADAPPDEELAAEPVGPPTRPAGRAPSRRDTEIVNPLHRVPSEVLAAELQRRGWVVMEP